MLWIIATGKEMVGVRKYMLNSSDDNYKMVSFQQLTYLTGIGELSSKVNTIFLYNGDKVCYYA